MVESADFSPFTPQFQQKLKCKMTLVNLSSANTINYIQTKTKLKSKVATKGSVHPSLHVFLLQLLILQ